MTAPRCPSCGATFPANAKFCPRDGAELVRDAPAGPPVPPVPPAGAGRHAQLAGLLLNDRFRVGHKVGEGGMSVVYAARDQLHGEKVAIKVLSAALSRDENAMERLRREAQVAGRLAHPNVCHIIQLGETADGLVFVVMPYLDGELLCDRVARVGQLPLDVVVGYTNGIAAGLHVAHELGVVHRDLKPENVMICARPDGTERAVVMDFGLAKQRTVAPDVRKLTATGIVLGTPEFMSPEQLRGKPLDPRSDVYALGLVVCEMLTGKLPFGGATQQDVMLARLSGEPTPLRQMRPDLDFPVAVEKVLLRCLERDPRSRYRSAPEFAAALAAAAQGRSATPRTASAIGRWLRREGK